VRVGVKGNMHARPPNTRELTWFGYESLCLLRRVVAGLWAACARVRVCIDEKR
jgi:hypothetical protein